MAFVECTMWCLCIGHRKPRCNSFRRTGLHRIWECVQRRYVVAPNAVMGLKIPTFVCVVELKQQLGEQTLQWLNAEMVQNACLWGALTVEHGICAFVHLTFVLLAFEHVRIWNLHLLLAMTTCSLPNPLGIHNLTICAFSIYAVLTILLLTNTNANTTTKCFNFCCAFVVVTRMQIPPPSVSTFVCLCCCCLR